jgi:isoleucyl-tRNA synthetase
MWAIPGSTRAAWPTPPLQYRTNREYSGSKWFPANWISESFPGQFRNWFYSLITMSTVFENRRRRSIVHGYATCFAEDGRPMHKSWGNAIWFDDAAENDGRRHDALALHEPEAGPEPALRLHRADETRRRFIIPLWNVYAFFVTYARIDEWAPPADLLDNPASLREGQPQSRRALDCGSSAHGAGSWIIARLRETVEAMTEGYETYIPLRVAQPAEAFLDDLSNWYVRRSRRRFWAARGASPSSDADKEAAYQTLYTVLVTFAKVLAPVLPFMAEAMYHEPGVRALTTAAPGERPSLFAPHRRGALMRRKPRDRRGDGGRAPGCDVGPLGARRQQPEGAPAAGAGLIAADPRRREELSQLLDLLADELNVKDVPSWPKRANWSNTSCCRSTVCSARSSGSVPARPQGAGDGGCARAVAQLHAGEPDAGPRRRQ